jgi:hypothetical protein
LQVSVGLEYFVLVLERVLAWSAPLLMLVLSRRAAVSNMLLNVLVPWF